MVRYGKEETSSRLRSRESISILFTIKHEAGRRTHLPQTGETSRRLPLVKVRVQAQKRQRLVYRYRRHESKEWDDEPSHGEVPGTAAHDMRSEDAVADEMVIATDDGTTRSSRPGNVDHTAEGQTSMPAVPITRVELVDDETLPRRRPRHRSA